MAESTSSIGKAATSSTENLTDSAPAVATPRFRTIQRVLCATLVLITIALDFKHAWDLLQFTPDMRKALEATFMSEVVIAGIIIVGLIASCLFLFRTTFKAGVWLQALSIFAVAILQLRAGHIQQAALEIPFILATLVMLYLGYPFDGKLEAGTAALGADHVPAPNETSVSPRL